MVQSLLPWLADLLIVFGLLSMTVAVYGIYWFPDLYTKLHAASKIMVIGVIPILVALLETGDAHIGTRAILIAAFLILTVPVTSHVIGRAAYLKKEPMETPDVVDQSNRLPHGRQDAESDDE